MNAKEQLIEKSIAFLAEVKDKTPNADIERWLNEKYGPGSEPYGKRPASAVAPLNAYPGVPGDHDI